MNAHTNTTHSFFVFNFAVATTTTPLVARLRAMGQADLAFSLVLRLGERKGERECLCSHVLGREQLH